MVEKELKNFKNREKLLDAALDEFSTHSFREASLNNIIKKAGVSKGSFYFHFRDKRSLYLYLFGEIAKSKKAFIQEYMAENPINPEKMNFFEFISESSKAGISFALKFPGYYRLASRFYREKDNEIYRDVKDTFMGDFDAIVRPEIEKSLRQGKFRKDFDVDFITRLINHLMLNFDAIFPYEDRKSLEKTLKLFEKYMDFIKFGLAGRNRKGK